MANLPYFGLFQLSPFSPKAHPLPGVCAMAPWQLLLVWACRAAVPAAERNEAGRTRGSFPASPCKQKGRRNRFGGWQGTKKGNVCPWCITAPSHRRSQEAALQWVLASPGRGLCAPHRPKEGAGGAGLSLPALHQELTPIGPAIVENQELQAILNELSK